MPTETGTTGSDERAPFGSLLKRYRGVAGLTQEELAEHAGLSARAVSDLERGVNTRPRPYTVQHLAEALRLSPDDRTVFERAAISSPAPSAPEDTLARGNFLGALPPGVLVAREEERDRIRTIIATVADGVGQVVLFGGETGIGKTRLLQQAMVEALSGGFLVLIGRCSNVEEAIPFYPFLQALRDLVAKSPARISQEVQRRWKRLQALVAACSDDNDSASRALARQDVFAGLSGLLVLVGEEVPLALLLDDLQWSDGDSLALLQHLARSTHGSQVLIAGSFRDLRVSDEHPDLAQTLQMLSRERLAERITVRRLSLEETTALVAATMGVEGVSEEFASFVYRRTKGIPRLIDQLVRSLGGRLELHREIGAGAMGRVFRAFDRVTAATVAAKLVLARQEIDLDTLLRFQQEGAVLAKLSHPHIVQIFGSFAEEHASCIIMELLEGQSLGRILQDGPLPLARAKHLALQVADALAYAHSHQIIHRDIKPDNVMVLDGDQAKVTDFGIARILQPDTSLHTIATTGMRMGTPLYMAPEQIAGRKIDGRTDVYALGAMLYHMVTGRPPFEGNDALAVAVKHLQEDPVPPSRIDPAIPADWDALILKAMAKDPAKRFQSAPEMQRAIGALPTVPARPRTRRIPRTLPAVAAGLGTSLVTVGVVLALLWPHFVAGQGQSPLQQKLDGYLSSLANQRRLSGTVLVAEKGKVLLAKGYGMANRQKKIPNSPTTAYAVAGQGSILVPAALRLEDEGRLHDQDHVCSYLPTCPRSWKPMTIHMVLAGIAGLPNSAWGTFGNTTAQSLANCQGEPLVATPGSGPINYQSCTGIVLGTIFQKVTRKPFAAAIRRLIFGPAGMRQSGRISDQSPPVSLAHEYSGSGPGQPHAYNDFFQIYSTAGDLYRYDNALFGERLLSQSALRRVFAPRDVVELLDPAIAGARWGYHWKMGTAFGHQVVYATGNSFSTTLVNMRFPAEGVTIIVMSNDAQNDVESVATHVAATLFGASAGSPAQAIAASIKTPHAFGLAPGSDGTIWIGGDQTGVVRRLDSATNKIVATIKINDPSKAPRLVDAGIVQVAAGSGQVWVSDRVHKTAVRIDPLTDKVVARIPVGIEPFGLAIAGDTLWVGDSYEDEPGVNTFVRIDLHTQKVVARITNATTSLGEPFLVMAATPDALWYADWQAGTVKRLNPATNKVVASITAGLQPSSVTVGDGAVWTANHYSNQVTRIDPATNRVLATIPLNGYPSTMAVGGDCCGGSIAVGAGGVWIVAGSANRTLVRIDPQTNRVTASLTFSQAIGPIAVANGSVWVEVQGDMFYRIDPGLFRRREPTHSSSTASLSTERL